MCWCVLYIPVNAMAYHNRMPRAPCVRAAESQVAFNSEHASEKVKRGDQFCKMNRGGVCGAMGIGRMAYTIRQPAGGALMAG